MNSYKIFKFKVVSTLSDAAFKALKTGVKQKISVGGVWGSASIVDGLLEVTINMSNGGATCIYSHHPTKSELYMLYRWLRNSNETNSDRSYSRSERAFAGC